jgi:hypothetical protein
VLDLIGKATPGMFRAAPQIDPSGARLLIEAIAGAIERAAREKNCLVSRRQRVFTPGIEHRAGAGR